MIFRQLFEPNTSTFTYLVASPTTREAVLIDPVVEDVDRYVALLDELGLTLRYTLETHVHADHVTGGGALRHRLGSQTVVRSTAGPACADLHVSPGDRVTVGELTFEVRATPGHTDGCVSYVLRDPTDPMRGQVRVFTGDALLIGGCGRTDFQQGDAGRLYDSVTTQLFTLPPDTLIYPGHDYRGRTVSTVREERAINARLGGNRSRDEFIDIMNNLRLDRPKQMDRAVPANLRCGQTQDAVPTAGEVLPAGFREILPADAHAHLAGFRLVDVRQPEEFAAARELGRISGATNVPLATVGMAAKDWPRGQRLLVICRSGRRSAAAAQELAAMGFGEVYNLVGGMLAWNEGNLPVVHGAEDL